MAEKKQEYMQIGNNNRDKWVSKLLPSGGNCGKSKVKCEIWTKVQRGDQMQMGVAGSNRENGLLEKVGIGLHVSSPSPGKPTNVYIHHHCLAGSWHLCFPFPKAAGLLLDVCVSAGAWQWHCCSAGHYQGNGCWPTALGIGPMAFRQAKSIKVLSSISYWFF